MNVKKILCSLAAAAVAVSMTAVNVFAATVTLDSEYPGLWKAGKCIPKADLEALGGDVRIVLDIEVKEPRIGEHLHHLRPIDHDTSNWGGFTDKLRSDTAMANADGNFIIADGQTSMEFIIPADVISSLADGGLGFMVANVMVKSAEITKADASQSAVKIITTEEAEKLTVGEYGAEPAEDEAAPAETEAAPAEDDADEAPAVTEAPVPAETAAPAVTEAPAAETAPAPAVTTTSPATGNVSAAVMVSVMAVAGAAAIASKKRK